MKGQIIQCFGCGYTGCSMCFLDQCKSEEEAIKKFAEYYPKKIIKLFRKAHLKEDNDFHGRTIFYRNYTKRDSEKEGLYEFSNCGKVVKQPLNKCGDCGSKPRYIIYELDGSIWSWCGICDIGCN